jgi:hypothetical protein
LQKDYVDQLTSVKAELDLMLNSILTVKEECKRRTNMNLEQVVENKQIEQQFAQAKEKALKLIVKVDDFEKNVNRMLEDQKKTLVDKFKI